MMIAPDRHEAGDTCVLRHLGRTGEGSVIECSGGGRGLSEVEASWGFPACTPGRPPSEQSERSTSRCMEPWFVKTTCTVRKAGGVSMPGLMTRPYGACPAIAPHYEEGRASRSSLEVK